MVMMEVGGTFHHRNFNRRIIDATGGAASEIDAS
jgi:hypothetical protein